MNSNVSMTYETTRTIFDLVKEELHLKLRTTKKEEFIETCLSYGSETNEIIAYFVNRALSLIDMSLYKKEKEDYHYLVIRDTTDDMFYMLISDDKVIPMERYSSTKIISKRKKIIYRKMVDVYKLKCDGKEYKAKIIHKRYIPLSIFEKNDLDMLNAYPNFVDFKIEANENVDLFVLYPDTQVCRFTYLPDEDIYLIR